MKKLFFIFYCSFFIFTAHAVEVVAPIDAQMFIGEMSADLAAFAPRQIVDDYVPIEARVGRAAIGGLSKVADVLDRSLVPFVIVFIIVMFAFWIMFEAYEMMRGGGENVRKLLEDIVKKAFLITAWIIVIDMGAAQLFAWLMGPTVSIGTYLSDLILNSVTMVSGMQIPDTCGAIHAYITQTGGDQMLMGAGPTADLLCLPTRMSGFFYTAVTAGWQWMRAGIGTSAFTFVVGAVFVVVFVYNMWKFALMALSAMVDMFLGIIMLPFAAIAQTTAKTTYAGYAGQIYNEFLNLFKATKSLDDLIKNFISAIVYFVSLSIVVAVCAALLSGVVDTNMSQVVPTLDNNDFMTTLIVGCLVAYLANKSGEIAKSFGGAIGDGLPGLENDIKSVWGNVKKAAASTWKIIRKK